MRTHLTRPLVTTALLALVAGLAGCGTDSTTPPPTSSTATVAAPTTTGAATSTSTAAAPSTTAAGPDTPTVVWAVQSGQSDSYKAGVDRWNAAHPNQPIDLQLMPDADYKAKIRVALGAGQGPDLIFGWGGGGLKDFIDAGYVDPLDSYVSQYADLLSKYLPPTLIPVQFGGKTYGVPIANMQPVVIYYNKPVFTTAGAQPPATWADVSALAASFNAAGISPFTLAGQSKWPYLPYIEYLVDRIGGPDVFNKIAANTPGSWSDPAVIQALTMIQDLVKAKGFVPNFSSLAYETGAADALLYTGKAAMLTMLASAYANINKAAPEFVGGGNLAYTVFPAVAAGKGDASNIVGNPSNYWSLNAKATASHKATAVQFLAEQVENPQWASEIVGRNGLPPIAAAESQLSAPGKEFALFCFNLVKNAKNFQMSWDQALSAEQGSALNTQLDRVFLLQITPQQFADEMNKTIKA